MVIGRWCCSKRDKSDHSIATRHVSPGWLGRVAEVMKAGHAQTVEIGDRPRLLCHQRPLGRLSRFNMPACNVHGVSPPPSEAGLFHEVDAQNYYLKSTDRSFFRMEDASLNG